MNRKQISWMVFIVLFLAMGATAGAKSRTAAADLLVSPGWLAAQTDDVSVIDFGRTKAEYILGHVPGAVFVDRSVVWNKVGALPGMLPPVGEVTESLRKAGVSNNRTVVVYDGGNGLWASRLFWALEYLGHEDVRVLDGGFAAWKDDGKDGTSKAPEATGGNFAADVQDDLIVDFTWLLYSYDDPQVKVVDTRSAKEFDGTDVRADRGGHVPGAVHIDWVENLPSDGTSFKSRVDLEDLYVSRDVAKTDTVVTHCQTGVRGAHTYLALRLLGYEDVRLYDGSWAEWGNSKVTPIE